MEYAANHWQTAARGHARELASRNRSTAAPSAALAMRAMAVEFPQVHGHPNRLPFEGVLTLVDVASDKAPSGARGHRVILSRAAAEAALPSLLGMAVDYKSPRPGETASSGWDGHDARQKCGIITAAELDGNRLTVAGFVFSRDFPEIEQRLSAAGTSVQDGSMGMSYELADAHVADMTSQIWTLTKATFTGAAILLREKAAYRETSFHISPRASGATTRSGAPCSTRVSRAGRGVTASCRSPLSTLRRSRPSDPLPSSSL